MRRTRSRAASRASPFRQPTARPRLACLRLPRARRSRSLSRTSAPTAANMSRSSSPTTIRARKDKGWTDGSVGLVTISQARKNGQARTAGFRDAMKTAGLTKEAGLQQMQSYTADETFKFTQDMLTANPNMKAMFIQTDQPTLGALRAIKAGHRDGTLLVAAFDGIPDFVDLLKKGEIVASGMQQPYLMGVKSGEALLTALKGGK